MILRLNLRRRETSPLLEAAAVLNTLRTPAALCSLDGAVLAANDSWRAIFGAARRPAATQDLFSTFRAARGHGRAVGRLMLEGSAQEVSVAGVGEGRFILQLEPSVDLAACQVQSEPPPTSTPEMDAFAAASPFGAALISGPDPFNGVITAVNPSLSRIAGPGARPGVNLRSLLTPASAQEAASSYAKRRKGPFEVALAAAPDRTAHLYLAGVEGGAAAYLQDVTEQKQMQDQLAQRNKMESIGQLAGGVAHDFNNLLSAIRLRAEELLLRHSLGDPSYESLAEIRQTVDRAADVVRQLLTFSRKATIQRETLDLGEALTHAEVLLRRLLRENVKLNIEYGQALPRVRIDRSQLENAVMNLVVNARDAVQAKGGGAVRIRTARLSEAEALALGYGGLPMGDMALIEVADDGPGITPEALSNIFEPFFTTKPLGEGTGLGLATVYGVVKQAEGWISVDSVPGEGAIFRIFLPVYTPPLALEPPSPAKSRSAPRDLSGVGRILFVEDEPLVRGVAARLLRGRGYEVIEAVDGEEALELAKANAGRIDLMISDVIMPGMDGPALLKAARPYLGLAPVMFISGYAEAEFSDLLEGEQGVSFLPKPLDIASLAEHVKAHLRTRERAA